MRIIYIASDQLTFLKPALGGRSPLSKEGDMFDGVEREIGAWTTKGLLIKVKQKHVVGKNSF